MIRINLLPVREAARRESGRQVVVIFVALLLLEAVGLFYFQSTKQEELDQLQGRNKAIQTKITQLRTKTAAVADLESKKAELEQQKAVLDGLIEGQGGPVKMLDELGQILTPLDGAEARLAAEARGWNPDWDPKRLWIDGFREKERVVQMTGHARTNEDLAEFLLRLQKSRHFVNTNLKVSEAVNLQALGDARFVQFNLETIVIYGPADIRKLAAGELGDDAKKKKKGH